MLKEPSLIQKNNQENNQDVQEKLVKREESVNYETESGHEDDTQEKIAQVRSWLEKEHSTETEFTEAVKNLQEGIKNEKKEIGTFGMLRGLWASTPPEAKMDIISDFIFNPNRLKQRYHEEKYFQQNLKSRWNK